MEVSLLIDSINKGLSHLLAFACILEGLLFHLAQQLFPSLLMGPQ